VGEHERIGEMMGFIEYDQRRPRAVHAHGCDHEAAPAAWQNLFEEQPVAALPLVGEWVAVTESGGALILAESRPVEVFDVRCETLGAPPPR
jgi:hypothetical protein